MIDLRYPGAGKTTESILRNKGKGYLHIFPDYYVCEEKVKESPDAYVLKGRPQLCDRIDEDVYDFIMPKCKGCQNTDFCGFFKQREEGQGNDIYTVPQNLELALKWFKPKTIVLDDVSLINLIYPYEDITPADLQKLNNYLLKHNYTALAKLTTTMMEKVGFLEDIGKEITTFVRKYKNILENEYSNLSEDWETIRDNKIKAKILSLLIKAKKVWVYGLFKENGEKIIRIVVKRYDKRNFRNKRIEYLNATPIEIELELSKELSSYPVKPISKDPPTRRNTTIIQITDSKFGSFDVRTGKNKKFNRINELLDEFFANTKRESIVLFTSESCLRIIRECYKNLFQRKKRGDERFENVSNTVTTENNGNYELTRILLHGKGSLGTNNLSNISKGIITGISFLPPSFFIRPPFIKDFAQLRIFVSKQKSKDRELFSNCKNISQAYKNKNEIHAKIDLRCYVNMMYELIQAYGIDTEEPVRNSVIQAIARIVREGDEPKLIVIVGNITIDNGEDFIPQIGCFVKKIKLGNFPKKNSNNYEKITKKWAEPLIKELRRWYKPILEKVIDTEVEMMESDKVTKEKAKMLEKEYGVFSWSWYYKKLKELQKAKRC
ncbi:MULTISPECIES: hypothetical protein [unclassified Archaeoglobus]|uniref:hypothetical protein n=1 Tax=unclassified Archaeoglobus TaxID=2643606 RepID=UPI0025BFB704|nr:MULTISPECIES: hypothetical protein [unclassified Archaeoglobus]